MKYLYSGIRLKQNRRRLRHTQTKEEIKLWNRLRNKQVDGIRFLRQYSVCNYILDFYCPKLRLGIELDGSQHNDEGGRSRDERRNMYLSSLDIKIVRFWNNDIWNNIEQVMEKIYQEIDNNPT